MNAFDIPKESKLVKENRRQFFSKAPVIKRQQPIVLPNSSKHLPPEFQKKPK